MNQTTSKYEDFAQVLAVIHEMIEESAYHTETFAHVLEAHHNSEAAKVFFLASEQFNTELAILSEDVENTKMPNIPPWDIAYPEYIHPSSLLVDAHYLMTEDEAWEVVQSMIKVHQDFYRFLAKESTDANVIRLTKLLAAYCEKCGESDTRDML